jgi:predicted dehydrogenase
MPSKLPQDLHAGIVGCGSVGARHLSNLVALGVPRFTVFDPQMPQTPDTIGKAEIGTAASLAALLDNNPDFLIIANPSDLHVAAAVEGARRGCDLFIEKPLGTTTSQLSELQSAIHKAGVLSMAAANMRFHPGPALVKKLLDAGEIGVPLWARFHCGSRLPKWRPGTDYRRSYSASATHGGAILDCIHEIDLATWLFGAGTLVSASHTPANTIGLECEGLAELITKHRNRMMVATHLNFVQQDYQRQIEVVGSDASLYWSIHRPEVRISQPEKESPFFVNPEPRIYSHPPLVDLNQMYVEQMAHFLECIATRTETCNPVSLAIKTTAVAIEARNPCRSIS